MYCFMPRFFTTLFLLSALSPSIVVAKQPNVVIILADDLGWSDTTLYGTTKYYQTLFCARIHGSMRF